ncbi:LysR family transcriptional regulator [Pseudohoeflea coraliihabitans]|uniref:LysR family transcriptional regulator n=1 Tax=Pseudohoeflea coraliihabitans TaxID=2860393 RepID=A0ABS6WQ93_9HYPH|nr:LysR family transcriptional regulator [Pseudohoeflea sp. DP4N28-3]MBW3097940.1 LysR family transcriptional regulator [Pseudohoeflea sp. DP4N28-3]
MDWNDGKLFLAVARAGQMLAAARVVGVNQATLSRRMAQLERSLGASLLIRHPQGSSLTDEGVELMRSLERIEAEFMRAQSALSGGGIDVSGTVRIGAPDGFGTSFLLPEMPALRAAHPKLTVQLVPLGASLSLSRREADIAVMVGQPETGRLVGQKLTDYTVSLYGSRAYLAANGTPQRPEDLAAHRLIGYVEDLVVSSSLDYARLFWPHWQSDLEIATATGQLQAIRHGAGIGVLHDYLAAGVDELVPVLPELHVERSYWLVYHESLRGIARVAAIVDFITTLVRQSRSAFVRRDPQA